jgi:uncharacterized membrane protein
MRLMQIVEEASTLIPSPEGTGAETLVSIAVMWLVLAAEILAAILIGIGIVLTLVRLIKVLRQTKYEGYEKSRLTLARFLAMALEFQLAADVLATAVAPTWTQIGKLGAIAVIRTALNYFLAKEIKEEEETTEITPKGAGLGSEAYPRVAAQQPGGL